MQTNKKIGAILLIIGTTLGAGMLGLPIASAGLSFSLNIFIKEDFCTKQVPIVETIITVFLHRI